MLKIKLKNTLRKIFVKTDMQNNKLQDVFSEY